MSEQPQRTYILLDWNKKNQPERTPFRRMGVRRAMAVGLQEYLEDLSAQIAGTKLQLQKVLADWAEPEDLGKYPGACVFSEGPCAYDANNFNSYVNNATKIERANNPAGGLYLAQTSECEAKLMLQVTCQDPVSRGLIEAMLEDALVPSDEYYGLALVLPHYHNEVAVYELQSVTYEDDAGSAKQRLRVMTFELDAQLSTNVVRSYSNTNDKTFRVESDVLEGLIPQLNQK